LRSEKQLLAMKSIYTLLLSGAIFGAGTELQAQSPGLLSGQVQDPQQKALAAVNVSLLRAADSSLVKLAISEKSGQYELNASPGAYLVQFKLTGYGIQYQGPFTLEPGQKIAVATATLEPVTTKLNEVSVTARKPLIEVKADKMVFNVENSINATGSNALELLQKSPGVQVDNNDNISMKGKSGVRVYVDGKMMQLGRDDLAAYLRSINSNDIEAIEMIANPSAKYDAAGNAGIVNIRLKKNKKFGTNGNASLGLVQGYTPKGNGSLNLNYRDQKVNLFGNVGGNIGIYENGMDLDRTQLDTLYKQRSRNLSENNSINVKAGADFFLTKTKTLGVIANVNYSDNPFRSSSETPIYYAPTGAFVKNLRAFNSIPSNRTNANFNVNYRMVDTAGRELNIDADYGLFRGQGRSLQPNYYVGADDNLLYQIVNRNFTPTDIDIYTAKADYEQKKWKGKLGVGAKVAYVRTRNTFDFFTDNAAGIPEKVLSRSNSFEYIENVNAAYVNYSRVLNPKWSFQAGLRLEQTNSRGELERADGIVQDDNLVKRSYLDFFPSGALTWNVHQNHALNLTYSRRIDRPTYQDLNPFENKLDELTFEKGNAFLRPQYTDNVELSHTFKGMLTTTVGFSHVKDFATQLTDTVGNATFVQQRNLATQDIISFSVGSPLQFTKWWSGYANVWYNYQMFRGSIGDNPVSLDVPTYGAYMQQTFKLGKGFSAEMSGWFNGPGVWAATWRSKSQGAIDLGVQKQFMQGRATAKIAATDIFFTAPWRATNNFGGMRIVGGGYWESRTVRVNLSWRFGTNQVKAARQRQTGLEQESKRIK
jgi:outer membrane receptor protein involved in Fe transport